MDSDLMDSVSLSSSSSSSVSSLSKRSTTTSLLPSNTRMCTNDNAKEKWQKIAIRGQMMNPRMTIHGMKGSSPVSPGRLNSRNYVVFLWTLLVVPALLWTAQWNLHATYQRESVNGSTQPVFHNESIIEDTNTSSGMLRQVTNLSDFDPYLHPVLSSEEYEPSSRNPLQVIYIGNASTSSKVNVSSEVEDGSAITYDNGSKSLLLEGINISKYIKLLATFQVAGEANGTITMFDLLRPNLNNSTPLVILVDWSRIKFDCHMLRNFFQQINIEYDFVLTRGTNNVRIVLVDDSQSSRIRSKCTDLPVSASVPISMSKRSIVEGRYWNHTKQWIEMGSLIENNDYDQLLGLPPSISDRWIIQLHALIKERYIGFEEEDYSDIFVGDTNRSTDIALLYDGELSHYSSLRRKVVRVLEELHAKNPSLAIKSMSVRPEDVNTTMFQRFITQSKILVFVQSDEWEGDDADYYANGSRFLQLLASGAMVFCDDMVAKLYGLHNKTNVIFYDSPDSLMSLVPYYLEQTEKRQAIARRGLRKTLGRHRTWHSLETLLFGAPRTNTDKFWENTLDM